MRFTTNAGASFTRTAVFFSFLATPNAVARGVVRLLAAHDLQQREDRDRVEEVEADDPLGVLQLRRHLRHRQRGRVRREDRVRRGDGLDLGEHLLLDADLLEDGLDDEVGVGEALGLVQHTGDQRLEAVGLVLVDAGLRQQLVDLGVDVAHTLVDALLVDVREDDRHFEAAQEEQGELRGHQARAHDAHLGDRTREGLVRGARGALAALLDQVERVDAGAQFATHDQVGERHVLGVVTLLQVTVLGRLDDVQGAVRGRSRPVHLAVGDETAARDGLVPGLTAVDLGALDGDVTLEDGSRPQQRLLQEVRALEDRVGDTEVEDLLALELLVLVERVLDDHRDGLVRTDQVRQDRAAAPSGDQTEEDLGEEKAGSALETVRYAQCRPTSTPPPIAAPL